MPQTLTITDNRTGKKIEVPVDEHGAFPGSELKKLGLVSFDQPLLATATARSTITYIDGDAGILRYRGYPIEQLAEKCSFLEVAYLLAYGELPKPKQRADWEASILEAKVDVKRIKAHVASFPAGSHPMAVLISGYAALGARWAAQAKAAVHDPAARKAALPRQLAETLVLGAEAIAASVGAKAGKAKGETYAKQFLVASGVGKSQLEVFGRALEVLFILHADHELNAGTNAMRAIGSADSDAYSCLAGAAAALYGPLHGGANEAVLKMLAKIGNVKNVPAFIESVKHRDEKLMGFGHRVYKNFDPRAKVIKTVVDEVLAVSGPDPLLGVAQELERIALEDEYFVSRKLYPNVDFYSGIAYKAIGFKPEAFTVLFGVPRTIGWLSHYDELLSGEYKITRPAQVYVGYGDRPVPKRPKRK